jgi:hypothetical protein
MGESPPWTAESESENDIVVRTALPKKKRT